ncbi:hypothetical protein GUITHDRAFT_112347 [Guillardia theta CCMP2712]|uniref:Uncharacterized protein n=1 Tax=Guillardia theta (strain CCMP2712) TaxID=905079 RepID=L1J0G6_GUITC|nr:hypothetical protein GUITHDRAFT_112347 [Guillardia theta CCMP2712]EKX41639.1 hypothetical protein GUITHDRAFT_112347 [Guillardia theta CCMP2712]|eukprot:XP_005828619.1 hypothetical protein GUITHDRAFT_112347 [Guillardia theta CCMP2712]
MAKDVGLTMRGGGGGGGGGEAGEGAGGSTGWRGEQGSERRQHDGYGEPDEAQEKMTWEDRVWFPIFTSVFFGMFFYAGVKNVHWRTMVVERRMFVKDLSRGWFLGLPQDLSDPQWKTLRKFFPLLFSLLVGHVLASKLARTTFCKGSSKSLSNFHAAVNLIFVIILHGPKVVWPLLTNITVFLIGQHFRGSIMNPVLTWLVCLLVLFSSDYYGGFETVRLAPMFGSLLSFWDDFSGLYRVVKVSLSLVHLVHFLPERGTQFNLSMLRLISFNTELYWSQNQHMLSPKQTNLHLYTQENFSLSNFLAYVLYMPLYIAGPIAPYMTWLEGLKSPQKSLTTRATVFMLARTFLYILLVEVMLHLYMYVSINNNRTWETTCLDGR